MNIIATDNAPKAIGPYSQAIEANGTLYIAFISGGVYSYTGVPESIFKNLMSAGAHGKYFHANIKNNYPYSRIG